MSLNLGLDAPPAPGPTALTERAVLDMLHARYAFVRPYTHARRYAVAEHVRNRGVGINLSEEVPGLERIVDFLAQDTYYEHVNTDGTKGTSNYNRLWPHIDSGVRRVQLHGHEVKVSRSDWLVELRDPSKADAWRRYCDRWWLVAPRDVVRDDLPEGWGHMAPDRSGRLRVVRTAPLLTPEPMPAMTRAQVMRAVQWTATIREALRPRVEDGAS